MGQLDLKIDRELLKQEIHSYLSNISEEMNASISDDLYVIADNFISGFEVKVTDLYDYNIEVAKNIGHRSSVYRIYNDKKEEHISINIEPAVLDMSSKIFMLGIFIEEGQFDLDSLNESEIDYIVSVTGNIIVHIMKKARFNLQMDEFGDDNYISDPVIFYQDDGLTKTGDLNKEYFNLINEDMSKDYFASTIVGFGVGNHPEISSVDGDEDSLGDVFS